MKNEIATIDERADQLSTMLRRRVDKAGAAQIAKMFLGQYPQRQGGDEDIYVRQLMDLIASYPEEIAMKLASVKTNPLPGSPFLPGIGEVRDAMDKITQPLQQNLTTQRQLKSQIENRDKPLTEEQRKANADRLRKLSEEISRGPLPADASEARVRGWPEWLWPEHEQSAEFKRRAALSERCQQPGALAAYMEAQKTGEDTQ